MTLVPGRGARRNRYVSSLRAVIAEEVTRLTACSPRSTMRRPPAEMHSLCYGSRGGRAVTVALTRVLTIGPPCSPVQ